MSEKKSRLRKALMARVFVSLDTVLEVEQQQGRRQGSKYPSKDSNVSKVGSFLDDAETMHKQGLLSDSAYAVAVAKNAWAKKEFREVTRFALCASTPCRLAWLALLHIHTHTHTHLTNTLPLTIATTGEGRGGDARAGLGRAYLAYGIESTATNDRCTGRGDRDWDRGRGSGGGRMSCQSCCHHRFRFAVRAGSCWKMGQLGRVLGQKSRFLIHGQDGKHVCE
jgi:hypothetical protein